MTEKFGLIGKFGKSLVIHHIFQTFVNIICDWTLENQPECHTRLILFLNYSHRLVAALINYPCTVELPGLDNWSSF